MAVASGTTIERAQLKALADLANSRLTEGKPYKFWGNIHLYYNTSAKNAETLASIPALKTSLPPGSLANTGVTTPWPVAVGDIAVNMQTFEAFECLVHPITVFSNWRQLPSSEFFVGNIPPAGPSTPGRAALEIFFIDQIQFNMGLHHELFVFRDGQWDRYGGWLTELNRMRYNAMRACRNNDPAILGNPSWLVTDHPTTGNHLRHSGPYVLHPSQQAPDAPAGFFSLLEGGIGNRSDGWWLIDVFRWPAGHQVSEIQCIYSDEADTLPTYRIEPEWTYQYTPVAESASPPFWSDTSGFRYEGFAPASFSAEIYTNVYNGIDFSNIDCSHPEFIKGFRSSDPVIDSILGPTGQRFFLNWRRGWIVQAVKLEGVIAPGETFKIRFKGCLPVADGTQAPGFFNGDSMRGRFVPAHHPEIGGGLGERFALYVQVQNQQSSTPVLHPTKRFKRATFGAHAGTFPLPNADRAVYPNSYGSQRMPAKYGQTGLVYIGFNERFTNPAAPLPTFVGFIGKTIPLPPLNLNHESLQLAFAPKARLPAPEVFEPSGKFDLYDRVRLPDEHRIFSYPCIRRDRAQARVFTGSVPAAPPGMIYRVDIARTPVDIGGGVHGYPAAGQPAINIRLGCVINANGAGGEFVLFQTINLQPGENTKTVKVEWPVFAMSLAYECAEDPNVLVTAVFLPATTPGPGGIYQYDQVYRADTHGYKWIGNTTFYGIETGGPVLADDYNGIIALLDMAQSLVGL